MDGIYLLGADLKQANLSQANLSGVDLNGVDLSGANLSGAYLVGADLSSAYLLGVELDEAIFDEKQVNILCDKCNLRKSKVLLSEENGIISYQEYCIRKQNG